MLLVQIILCLVAARINADDKISFKNVSVQLGEDRFIHVTSCASLKTALPSNVYSAKVHGTVPVLYEDSVADLRDTRFLRLDNVSLREIHPGAFRNLPFLSTLSVDKNNIQVLRENSFSHINTNVLGLTFNSITTLEPGVFKHSKIVDLFLKDNKISKIPKGLFENVTIQNLWLEKNNLRVIEDDAFLGMQREELEALYLEHNELEVINPETFNFPNLQVLELRFNLIKVLRPGDLKNMPKLKEVWFLRNRLKEIADGVFSNSKIERLFLPNNEISSVSSGAFDNMTELVWLDIMSNNLTKWNENWFRNTPKLHDLTFEYNNIEEIPDNAFQNLQGLSFLNLQDNEIAKISSSLGTNFSIELIDMSKNKLKCIEGDLREIFRNVGKVDFRENRWDQSCENKVREYRRSYF